MDCTVDQKEIPFLRLQINHVSLIQMSRDDPEGVDMNFTISILERSTSWLYLHESIIQ